MVTSRRAVILAGGRGTRLAPYTAILPKPLVPIGQMPILEIILRQLHMAEISRATLAVGYLAPLLEAYFGDGQRFSLKIDYSYEESPLGTAGPLRLIKDLKEDFLLMNGDLLTDINFLDLWRFHREKKAAATLAVCRREERIELGVIKMDGDGRVSEYVEKPCHQYLVSTGIYVLEPRIIDFIPEGSSMDLPELVRALIQAGECVVGYPFSGAWLDIGRPDDYAEAQKLFEKGPERFL